MRSLSRRWRRTCRNGIHGCCSRLGPVNPPLAPPRRRTSIAPPVIGSPPGVGSPPPEGLGVGPHLQAMLQEGRTLALTRSFPRSATKHQSSGRWAKRWETRWIIPTNADAHSKSVLSAPWPIPSCKAIWSSPRTRSLPGSRPRAAIECSSSTRRRRT